MLGISVSVENIEAIIKIIKNSDTVELAKKSLLNKKWKITKTGRLIKLINSEKVKTHYSLSEAQKADFTEKAISDLKVIEMNPYERKQYEKKQAELENA